MPSYHLGNSFCRIADLSAKRSHLACISSLSWLARRAASPVPSPPPPLLFEPGAAAAAAGLASRRRAMVRSTSSAVAPLVWTSASPSAAAAGDGAITATRGSETPAAGHPPGRTGARTQEEVHAQVSREASAPLFTPSSVRRTHRLRGDAVVRPALRILCMSSGRKGCHVGAISCEAEERVWEGLWRALTDTSRNTNFTRRVEWYYSSGLTWRKMRLVSAANTGPTEGGSGAAVGSYDQKGDGCT